MMFILPFIIGFLCFMLLPLVDSFWMSLCRVDVTAGQGFQTTFIGLDNYIRAFTIDPEFPFLLYFSKRVDTQSTSRYNTTKDCASHPEFETKRRHFL